MSFSLAASRAFLKWCVGRGDHPAPEHFLEDDASVIDGRQVTSEELEPAVQRMVDSGLLSDKMGAWGRAMPLRCKPTADGRRCVDEFDGDVQAWNRRNAPQIDQSVNVTAGRDAQVAAHSQHVSQVQNSSQVDVGKLAEAARSVSQAVPALGLTADQADEVQAVTAEILAESEKPEPDQSRLKALGTKVLTVLPLAASGGALTKLLIDAVSAAFA